MWARIIGKVAPSATTMRALTPVKVAGSSTKTGVAAWPVRFEVVIPVDAVEIGRVRIIGIDAVEACADLASARRRARRVPGRSADGRPWPAACGGGAATHFGVVHTRREIEGTGQVRAYLAIDHDFTERPLIVSIVLLM